MQPGNTPVAASKLRLLTLDQLDHRTAAAIDPALYATLGNAQRRLLETIGLRRRARDVTPSVDEYVARLNGGAAT